MHFSGWPDCGVPESDEELEGYRKVIEELFAFYTTGAASEGRDKALVHCRQGHGRTGTTLLILSRLLQAHYGTKAQISFIDTLKALRTQRSNLVETPKQFKFAKIISANFKSSVAKRQKQKTPGAQKPELKMAQLSEELS